MRTKLIFTLAVLFIMALPALQAEIIFLNSNTQTDVLQIGPVATPGLKAQTISPHNVWAQPPTGSFWISYTNSGIDDPNVVGDENPVVVSPNNFGAPAAIFGQSFHTNASQTAGFVRVWADDTTGVILRDATANLVTQLKAPSFPLGNACAERPIGCTTDNSALLRFGLTPDHDYTLTFEAYQLGGDTFGVAYAGQVVPEPTSAILLGTLVLGAFLVRRRARA